MVLLGQDIPGCLPDISLSGRVHPDTYFRRQEQGQNPIILVICGLRCPLRDPYCCTSARMSGEKFQGQLCDIEAHAGLCWGGK